jgi:hypothetical protein
MNRTQWKLVLAVLSVMFSFNAYAEEEVVQVQKNWQCYAVDQGGHYWKSTGMTQERAGEVAMSFCGAYSPNGKSCQVSKCMEV